MGKEKALTAEITECAKKNIWKIAPDEAPGAHTAPASLAMKSQDCPLTWALHAWFGGLMNQ